MRTLGRFFFPALAGVLAVPAFAPLGSAESLNITSAPAGANVEIDGALVGTTPFHTDYPGGYFHKTHTVFGARLEHAMTLRVSKDGYAAQQITITEGPFEWLTVNGKRRGNYFVLKSDHLDMKLAAGAEIASTTRAEDLRVGPMHSQTVTAALGDEGEKVRVAGTGAWRLRLIRRERRFMWMGILWGRRRRHCVWRAGRIGLNCGLAGNAIGRGSLR